MVRVYADEGITGTQLKHRIQFLQMMSDAEHRMFDLVVVKDVSRFARNTVDLLQSVRRLTALGIETQFLTANMTSMGDSEFVLTILGAMAQEESANLSNRIKFGLRVSAQKGRCISQVYGYDRSRDASGSPKINPAEAAVIRQIFSWFALEGYAPGAIAKMLNERGEKTKRNLQWSETTVRKLLSNEMYLGKILRGKTERVDFLSGKTTKKDRSEWIVTDRPDLRIIEPDLFQQAQKALLARSRAHRTGHHHESNQYLFSTLLQCKECGYSFTRFRQRNATAWKCFTHPSNRSVSCQNKTVIPEAELIDMLQAYFTELLSSQGQIMETVHQAYQRQFWETSAHAPDEAQIAARLSKLERTKQKYVELFSDDLVTQAELEQKLNALNRETDRLKQQQAQLKNYPSTEAQLTAMIQRTFQGVADIADVRQMTNAQLKRVLETIAVDKDGNVDIFLRPLHGPLVS